MTESEAIDRVVRQLLLSGVLMGDSEGSLTMYTIYPDDVEYLVRTVVDLWAEANG